MFSFQSPVSARLRAPLRVVVVAMLLVETVPAAAADSLPAAPEARVVASFQAPRVECAAVPAYGDPCGDRIARCDDVHVFAATRSLRQAGIQPAAAAVLAPATLLIDAVFFPFALALDRLAN
jgi:hypothetical protein